jgi:hypothetical protein
MPDADDVLDAILDNATQPQVVEGDMGKVQEHSLSEQIEAHRFAKAQTASTANRLGGLRIKKMVPPDANGS